MTKQQLQEILSGSFSDQGWNDVLKDIFSVKRLNQKPQAIALPSNDKAKAAFELGSLDTTDDRLIGLYLVEVKPNVWLEENRVGLRNLLRNIYKYDVDGALVVFTQKDKWRLSFVSEIRVANDEGELVDQVTEPKRYTYFLGEGEKVKTPTDRIYSLRSNPISLEDIRDAFSVEALNEEFYKIVAHQFYELVGATEEKGNKTIKHNRTLQLPSVTTEDRKTYQEFAVRLIGRTVFCWFLKMKKPDHANNGGVPLLPESLLSSEAVRKNKGYYHNILELLFFQTLNTPMNQRIQGLPKGTETIPFLNGGLFEPQTDDFYKPDTKTGLSKNLNTLIIPDEWFVEFFEKLEQFNFTIDENSVVDVEVSVDPEMLGRIFENLLAEIDPDSGETARKATGSFYTPREIVDYMASEGLVQYLVNKTGLDEKQLHPLFRLDQEVKFKKTDAENILDALDKLKILDPACGSGAFPIGVLQKIVMALQKLDPQSRWWKERQIEKVDNALIRKQIRESNVEYARKLGVIQNSLFGVDIQPIAAEISKLRCFLSLVVDEEINEKEVNRGIKPLPNLEFKFVTADTLRMLPKTAQVSLHQATEAFNPIEQLKQLQSLRVDYLQSTGKEKENIKDKFRELQTKIYDQSLRFGTSEHASEFLISTWNPFSHDKVDWFDPLWMFGVEKFNIIIGNPPYGTTIKGKYRSHIVEGLGKVPDFEIYYYFIKRTHSIISDNGVLSYIIPNTYLFNTFALNYRKELLSTWSLIEILDCTKFPIFQNAVVRNTINLWVKGQSNTIGYRKTKNANSFKELIQKPRKEIYRDDLLEFNSNWGLAFLLDQTTIELVKKIKRKSKDLEYFFPDISQGLIAYDKYQGQDAETIKNRAYHYNSPEKKGLKKWLHGGDVRRYDVTWNGEEYIDYCDGIANPRDPKFFIGRRILIREITNPSIYAALTDEEMYNDPSIIIIKDNNSESLGSLLAILNSKLASFYHFNSSPKATKGAFPKILIQDVKFFPLPLNYSQKSLEKLSDYIIFLSDTEIDQLNDYVPNSHLIQLFEEIIDAIVCELYFEEDFKKAGIEFIKYAERDFPTIEGLDKKKAKSVIHDVYQKLRQKDNEIRNNLKLMDIRLRDLIMPIKTAR